MKKGFIYWLRWILVIPGALISGFLMTFPLHWFLYLALGHDGASLFGFIEFEKGLNIVPIEYFLSPFVIALTFILVGAKIAPDNKFKASVVMLILWFTAIAGMLIYTYNSGLQPDIELRAIGTILGPFISLYLVKQEQLEQ